LFNLKLFIVKKVTIISLLLFAFFGNIQTIEAQFWKKLGKRAADAAKETVTQKVENKTSEKTGNAMDTILNSDKKIKKISKHKKKKNQSDNTSESDDENSENKVNSKKDFISGSHAIYTDTFKNDAIGDFPVTWNTNSSGEVVTFNNNNTKWLQLDLGQYTPDEITEIPENCTFEFDLTVSNNFDWYSDGIWVNIISVKDKRKDFAQWSRFSTGSNGVRLRLKPKNFDYVGETSIQTYLDNEQIIDNKKNNTQFTLKNNSVHVALWRQKNRLRVYLNDEKIWDIPRAFGNANYNAISFNTAGIEKEHFYVANLRLANAGEDTRHPLLETGRFETSDILFDVNKATIKPSSFKILNDLGKVLQDNPNVSIKIIGHTDSDGSAQSNLILSKKRAESIKTYLSDNFPIAGKRMQTIGKGESEPVENNSTAKGKAKNRRVEFIKL
jgi:outer membrane protein OmpA-like peptidoglycan-associated protein